MIELTYGLKSSNEWDLETARKESAKENHEKNYHEILYRPFDKRFIYYAPSFIERMRYEVMQHMLQENISFCFVRQYSGTKYILMQWCIREYC